MLNKVIYTVIVKYSRSLNFHELSVVIMLIYDTQNLIQV